MKLKINNYINKISMSIKEYDLSSFKNINNFNKNNIIRKKWVRKNKIYEIIKYNKEELNYENIKILGLYRSIVCDENKILCFSPPKSINFNIFMNNFCPTECKIEEFVEGTMINLFYDKNLESWEISSKSSVGANVKFFQDSLAFNELFYEICEELKIDFEKFSKQYCYSFVIQHPNNKFVIPFTEKKLYLIAIYEIDNENLKIKELERTEYENLNLPENLSYPFGMYVSSFEELYEKYGSMNTSIYCMGIIIKAKNGIRSKIRNPNYEYIKHLKGNNTKLQFQYISLRKLGKVNEYLKYFPENIEKFTIYREQIHKFTDNLLINYINCYIKKNKPLKEFLYQFRTHIFTLHQKYLSIRKNGGFINKSIVINYVNNLEPAKLLYSLNYHLRDLNINNYKKQKIDIIK